MKLNNARTQIGLAEAITARVKEFELPDLLEMLKDPEKANRVLDAVNDDRRQKRALVDFRADLADKLATNSPNTDDNSAAEGSLKLLERNITKRDDKGNPTRWETDSDFIERVQQALMHGHITAPDLTVTGSNELKEKAVDTWLQNIANSLPGDAKHDDGKGCYVLDLNRAVRTGGKGPGVPKWALDTADQAFAKGHEHVTKLHGMFMNGYTAGSGVVIDPFPFTDFRVVAPHDATPEAKQAVHESNRKALARAIATARQQEDEKRQSDFV